MRFRNRRSAEYVHLAQISSDPDLVTILRRRFDPDGIIKLLQTSNRDRSITSRVNFEPSIRDDGWRVRRRSLEFFGLESEYSAERTSTRKASRRLNDVHMTMESGRETIRCGPYQSATRGNVLPHMVFLEPTISRTTT